MKTLYKRGAQAKPEALRRARIPVQYSALDAMISRQPAQDRLRNIGDNQRILGGVKSWAMDRLQYRGIMCYERALGRMTSEHKEWKGKPTVQYMTSLGCSAGALSLTLSVFWVTSARTTARPLCPWVWARVRA